MLRVLVRLQEDDGDRLALLVDDQFARGLLHLVLIEGNDDLAEHVDPLGDAARQLPRHERCAVSAVLHVADFGPLQSDECLLATALGVDVLEAARGDQARPVAGHVDHAVEHRGAGVDGRFEVIAEALLLLLRDADVIERFEERFHVSDTLVSRRRGCLPHDGTARFIDDDHVGHRPACVAGSEKSLHLTVAS